MTPDEAAAVLGIRLDADEAEVDRAYRRLARELHPDRFIGAPESSVQAANVLFVDVTAARDILLKSATPRARAADHSAAGPSSPRPEPTPRPPTLPPTPAPQRSRAGAATAPEPPVGPFSWWLFGAWSLLLMVGALFSLSFGPLIHPADPWLRLIPLVLFALATALARRHWVWRVTLVLIALTAVATVIDTTIVGLLGLGFMIIASFGLAMQARLVRFPD
jgi:DnaJ domain